MFKNKNLFAACAFDLSVEAIDPCLSLSARKVKIRLDTEGLSSAAARSRYLRCVPCPLMVYLVEECHQL